MVIPADRQRKLHYRNKYKLMCVFLITDINTCPKIAGKILDQYWRVAGESGGGGEGGRRARGEKGKKDRKDM